MKNQFNKQELKKIYQILNAYDLGLIVNPAENWEMDYYDGHIVDKRGLKQILKKIWSLLSKEEIEELNKVALRRKYSSFNNEIDESVYKKIEKSFSGNKTIEIGYFNTDSAEIISRPIDVYYKSRKYIVAYCHLRKAIRKFRTSRIVSAKITEKNYQIPDDFNKNNYL